MHGGAGQLPNQPTVNRSEGQLPVFRQFAGVRNVVQDPCDLAGGEIRVDHQPRTPLDQSFMTFGLELIAKAGGATILPDDGIAHRSSSLPIPYDGGLAL